MIPVRCSTRPSRLLCLVADPECNWVKTLDLLKCAPAGGWATVIPLTPQRDVEPSYDQLIEANDADLILTVGDVPAEIVGRVRTQTKIPADHVLSADDPIVSLWRHQRSQNELHQDQQYGWSGVSYRMLYQPPSRVPIPVAAFTGTEPVSPYTQFAPQVDESLGGHDVMSLERLLQTYNRDYDEDPDEVLKECREARSPEEHLYVLVGTEDPVADFFRHWNLRRIPALRKRCIWLPQALLSDQYGPETLQALRKWIENPRYAVGLPPSAERHPPESVVFISESPNLFDSVLQWGEGIWVPGWDLLSPGSKVTRAYIESYWRIVLDRGITVESEDSALTLHQNGEWSLTLPPCPDSAAPFPVTEVSWGTFAGLPPMRLQTKIPGEVQSTPHGLKIFRSKLGSYPLVIREPSALEVVQACLGPVARESDKAGPVVSLLRQVGGIERCGFLENAQIRRFIEDASLESIHRNLKRDLMGKLEAAASKADVESAVDAVVRKIGREIRRRRQVWYTPDELKLSGIDTDTLSDLYQMGLFDSGLKLRCPVCRLEGHYSPHALGDFTCQACGWQGRAPLTGHHVSIFYSLRNLVNAVSASGGIPVILTLRWIQQRRTRVRAYPGIILDLKPRPAEIDIVGWAEAKLEFYEVKQSWRHAKKEALDFYDLCQVYGAVPVFAALEGNEQLKTWLANASAKQFRIVDLTRVGAADPVDD